MICETIQGTYFSFKNVDVFSVVLICLGIEDKTRFLYLASKKGMTTKDYVYIYYALIPDQRYDFKPWDATPDIMPSEIPELKDAYYSYQQVGFRTEPMQDQYRTIMADNKPIQDLKKVFI